MAGAGAGAEGADSGLRGVGAASRFHHPEDVVGALGPLLVLRKSTPRAER